MMSSPMVLSLLLFASLTVLLLLAPRLSPPPPGKVVAGEEVVVPAAAGVPTGGLRSGGVWAVGNEPDDLALFRHATLEAGAGAAGAPPKVAVLFLTNSDLTFAPLWERFFAGHEGRFSVYTRHSRRTALYLPPPTASDDAAAVVPSHPRRRSTGRWFRPKCKDSAAFRKPPRDDRCSALDCVEERERANLIRLSPRRQNEYSICVPC